MKKKTGSIDDIYFEYFLFLNQPLFAFKVQLISAIDSWCPKTLVTIPNICKMEKNLKNSICMYWKIVSVNFPNLNRSFAWDFSDMLVGTYIYQNAS